MNLKMLATTAALVVVVAGCSSTPEAKDAGSVEPSTSPVTKPVEVETVESEPEPEPEAEPVEYKVLSEWEDSSGVAFVIDGLGIAGRDALDADEQWILDEDTVTVLVLTGSITNATDSSIEFYPDQGTLVAGSDQYEASFISDLGGTIHDGVTVEGEIVFESTREMDWFDELDELRFLSGGAYDSDSFDDITDPIDIPIRLGR